MTEGQVIIPSGVQVRKMIRPPLLQVLPFPLDPEQIEYRSPVAVFRPGELRLGLR